MNVHCAHCTCANVNFVFAHSKSIRNGWYDGMISRRTLYTLKYQQLHLYLNIYASSSILIADYREGRAVVCFRGNALNTPVYQTRKREIK